MSQDNQGIRAIRASTNRYQRIWIWSLPICCVIGILPGVSSISAQVPDTDARATPVNRNTVIPRPLDATTAQVAMPQVTLVVRDSTVAYVLRTLASQARLGIAFDKENPVFAKRITVQIRNLAVMDAIASVLHGTGVIGSLAPNGETIIIRPAASKDASHKRTTSALVGHVTDSASSKGVNGATVSVLGTSLRVLTDAQGRFTLTRVPAGEQLLSVKLFGYKSTERKVTVPDSGRVSLQVVLVPLATILSGMVTSATGPQRRLEVGSDVATINVDSVMQIAPISSVTDLLAARIPGVIVMPSSGVPGAPSRIRLRGTGSIERDNDPIVIVDGVRVNAQQPIATDSTRSRGDGNISRTGFAANPSPLDQIDPHSIEKIEVFRGPSASALYGADAGNGVIVITTKRGQAGPTRWSQTVNVGRSSMPGTFPVNYFAYGRTRQGADRNCWANSECVLVDSVKAIQPLNDPAFTVLGHGAMQSGSFTVSGGERSLTYSLTGSALNDIGVLRLPALEVERFQQEHDFPAPQWMRRPDRYTMWSGLSNVNLPVGHSGGMVSLISSLVRSTQRQSSLQTAIAQFQSSAILPWFDGTGPLLKDFYVRQENEALTFRNTMSVTGWTVRSWLPPITASVGVDAGNGDTRTVLPHGYVLQSIDSIGSYAFRHTNNTVGTINIGSTIHIDHWGRLPGAMIPFGFQLVQNSSSNVVASSDSLPPGIGEPPMFDHSQSDHATTSTYGWYIAPTLNMHARLFVSPGIRFDGGSASGSSAGFSPFPKMDVSWIAIDRPSDPVFGFLTMLRPRMAYGIAGVQPAPGDHLRLFKPWQSTQPGTPSIEVAQLYGIGNTQLRPERSRELEGGFDAELWNQRITMTLSGYQKNRYDAIVTSPLAPSVGAGNLVTFKQNVGTVRNTGFDATIGLHVLDAPIMSWYVNTNYHTNKNILVTMAPGVSSLSVNGQQRLVPGYPLFGIWNIPIVGFHDVNDDGLITRSEVIFADSAVFIGAQEPNYQMTVSTSLSLFNGYLRFSTALDYQNGMTQVLSYSSNGASGPIGQMFRPGASFQEQANSYINVQKIDMLRWQSLSLNWQVPVAATRWLRLSSLSMALQGSNLGLRTNYNGKDPSVNSVGAGGNSVVDHGALPSQREWRLNIVVGG